MANTGPILKIQNLVFGNKLLHVENHPWEIP